MVTSHRSTTSSSPAGTSRAPAPPGVASPESPAAYAAATLRPHLDGATGAEISSNWAGQLATGAPFTSIGAQWTVPAVQLSASVDYSLTAIGVDGTTDSLIQAGTEQNSDGGSTSYGAWYEVYPARAGTHWWGGRAGRHHLGEHYRVHLGELDGRARRLERRHKELGRVGHGELRRTGHFGRMDRRSAFDRRNAFHARQLRLDGVHRSGARWFSTSSAGTLDPVYMAASSGAIIAYPGAFDASTDSFPITYGTPPPQVDSISPSEGPTDGNTKVTITGQFLDGATSVDFGTVASAFVENTDGTITATAPPGPAGTVDVTVSTAVATSALSNADRFTYLSSVDHGYWLVGGDGGIFTFGTAQFYGSTGATSLQRPVVGITPTTDRAGYWLVASDGGMFAFGDAGFFGSIPGLGIAPAGSAAPRHLDAPIVGMVPSADGGGYFVVAADGGVFAFGDARFAGSCPGIGGCSGAAVAVMPDATGDGYWVVTASGHLYGFGDATDFGAPGPQGVAVTSAVRAPDGRGYWILFANGAVAGYGDAADFGGPLGVLGGHDPATAIFATADGGGYWVTSANGAVYSYGDAAGEGSMAGKHLNATIVAATGW